MSDTACVSAMSAAFLPSPGHPGCDHGVPADPTVTRLSPRTGFPDRDPGDPTATWLTRLHLDQHNCILAVGVSMSLLTRRRPGWSDGEPATRFSRRDQVIPTATRLTCRHHYQHDILAVRRFSHRDRVPDMRTESWLCSGHAGRVPAVPAVSRSYDCVPDTLSDTWLCRQYPGVCPLSVTHRLLFPVETKIISAGPFLQSFTHPPFVTLLSIHGHGHQL